MKLNMLQLSREIAVADCRKLNWKRVTTLLLLSQSIDCIDTVVQLMV